MLAWVLPTVAAYHPQPLPDGELLRVSHAPDPMPGDSQFSIVAEFANATAVDAVHMKYCLSENRNATVCYVPMTMPRDGATFQVTSEHAIPPDQEFGYNLTIEYADGTTQYYPSGNHTPSNAYVFLRTLPADRGVPAVPLALMVGVALATALLTDRRRA